MSNSTFNKLLESLRKHEFVGRWQLKSLGSTSTVVPIPPLIRILIVFLKKLLGFLDSTTGKTRMGVASARNVSYRMEIGLYDGDYIDGKFLGLRLFELASSAELEESENSVLIHNLRCYAYHQERFELTRKDEIWNISLLLELTKNDPQAINVKIELLSNNATSFWFEAEYKIDEVFLHLG